LPGTQVEFFMDGSEVYFQKAARTNGANLIRMMRGKGSVRLSTDQIMNLTRR